jgi:protein arginine N-methyltransferase 5
VPRHTVLPSWSNNIFLDRYLVFFSKDPGIVKMSSNSSLDPESESFESRPVFYIGQHDSARKEALTDDQYTQVLNSGFRFVTAPITNQYFQDRVVGLLREYLKEREQWAQKQQGATASQQPNPSLPGPVVPTLTDKDTALFPSDYLGSLALYSSPWIDLCSPDPHISSISRQVLNLEAAYANFCGARTIVIPGPRQDDSGRGIAQYARAIREAMHVANRANIIIHMPMYREPGLEEKVETLSSIFNPGSDSAGDDKKKEVDLFGAWDSWNTIRSVCSYSMRLFVAIRIPRRVPEKTLQERWFAEPLHYLTISQEIFQANRAGHPSLSRHHQELIDRYMRLRSIPWLMLIDVGPSPEEIESAPGQADTEFPSLAEANQALRANRKSLMNPHVGYMRYLERQQPPFSAMETPALTSFQDWLQPPLQPLADNLESATYEVFEGDPVKYDQYEKAITEAMIEWRELKKPTSTATPENPSSPELVVTVAGAGRGPLVSRALRAAESTGTPIQIWALEKNQDAYVYLLRKNKVEWDNKVTLVKTDMRGWEGPRLKGREDVIGKVDILVTELLGSFGDNELSPECLDGIQNHLARPHGISIPHSYTAHLSPISTPRLFADISSRVSGDPNAFETPWVVRLFAFDFVAQKVPDHPRFQQAWEFVHPVDILRADEFAAVHGKAAKYVTGGVGSMSGTSGTNEHNARHCHLTFVCPTRGVIHGLAGFFESVLYASQTGEGKEPVEISILPDQIDRKSRDMISWFPIFFPLKVRPRFPDVSR